MSNDIKVGDVCEVLRGGYYFPAGTEVTVITGPRMYPFAPTEESFEITDASGMKCWAYRSTLRKKPPKKSEDAEPRTEFVPAEGDFVEDLRRSLAKETA